MSRNWRMSFMIYPLETQITMLIGICNFSLTKNSNIQICYVKLFVLTVWYINKLSVYVFSMVCTLDEASYHYFRPSVMHLIWYCFVLVLNSLLSDLSTLQGYVECVKWYCHHAMHCMKFHIPVQKSEASLWSPTSELLLCLISRRTLHR